MTYREKRFAVIARRASRRCATRTVGHDKLSDGRGAWLVVPWSETAVRSTILDAIREAIRLERRAASPKAGGGDA